MCIFSSSPLLLTELLVPSPRCLPQVSSERNGRGQNTPIDARKTVQVDATPPAARPMVGVVGAGVVVPSVFHEALEQGIVEPEIETLGETNDNAEDSSGARSRDFPRGYCETTS